MCPSGGPSCGNNCTKEVIPLKSNTHLLCNHGDESEGENTVDSDVCCPEDENNRVCKVKHKKKKVTNCATAWFGDLCAAYL